MPLIRRRFLTIAAACAALPASAQAHSWNGRAFGADISITIRGGASAQAALSEARKVIAEIEGLFTLYDPKSPLVQLNAQAVLLKPDIRFLELMNAADHAFNLTDGLFDPSVQRLWEVMAANRKPTEYFDTVGWDRVTFSQKQITLDRYQALTFNGIAQGYATDKVTEVLTAFGLTDVLVNIGEHRSAGGRWTLGLTDPVQGNMGNRTLKIGAIATSSPMATPLAGTGHILHTIARPKWSTVSVEAPNATLADSLSTAMVLAPRDQIEAIKAQSDVTRVTLVDFNGDLVTV